MNERNPLLEAVMAGIFMIAIVVFTFNTVSKQKKEQVISQSDFIIDEFVEKAQLLLKIKKACAETFKDVPVEGKNLGGIKGYSRELVYKVGDMLSDDILVSSFEMEPIKRGQVLGKVSVVFQSVGKLFEDTERSIYFYPISDGQVVTGCISETEQAIEITKYVNCVNFSGKVEGRECIGFYGPLLLKMKKSICEEVEWAYFDPADSKCKKRVETSKCDDGVIKEVSIDGSVVCDTFKKNVSQ